MGSTSYLNKSKVGGYRAAKSGSSVCSDKEMNGKLRRAKIRRPVKMNEFGLKRIPDYTELAYKEAVSKLRYFLSGNYAPSMRSYGGSPSIKNLDESDGDTVDKKYGSSAYGGALSEYKPRPRLTTKYTTLYADSLKNYTPATNLNNVPPAAATSDLTGGTNPDVVHFIQKQEEYIEQLERESQYCRDELNNLLGKVKEVISENEHLHEAQKNKLISRMFHSYTAGSETDDLDDVGDSTGLDSDHKATPSKTRKSNTKSSRSTKLEGPNIVFESRISELEAQLTQSKIDLKKVQDENNENKRKLASGLVDSTCLDGFKRQIDNLQRDKSALEAQITKLKLNLDQRDGDMDLKYKRGSDVVEHQLREERNTLEAELRRLKDDLCKERSKIRELAGEGARRAVQERSAAEQRYNAHFDELSHDLAAQYDNVSKLQLDLERQRREESDLKRELSMKNAAIEELKMELKNKSSSLQTDLAQAYAEKASLDEELASARLAIERHQRQSKHEANRLNSEIQSLRQRLDRADADLVHSRRENLRLSEQIAALEKELNMKSLTPMSPEKNKKEKELSTALESIENKHAQTVAELESMIHSQNSLMEKLTGECRLLTDKLDDANSRHKEELATLQRKVDSLGRSLQPASPHTTHASSYEAPTAHTTASLRHDSNTPSYTGQDYTRTNPTGHPQISRQPSNVDLGEDKFNSNHTTSPGHLNKQPLLNTFDQKADENVLGPERYEQQMKDTVDDNFRTHDSYEQPNGTDRPNLEAKADDQQNNTQYDTVQDYGEEPTYQPNYDQSGYEPNYAADNPEYQAEYNQQNYPQPQDGQYGENYQQYSGNVEYDPNTQQYDPSAQQYDPNAQQYDPNAQPYDANDQPYEGVYDNVNYENQPYNAANQEYDPQYAAPTDNQYVDDEKDAGHTEKQRSNSPQAYKS